MSITSHEVCEIERELAAVLDSIHRRKVAVERAAEPLVGQAVDLTSATEVNKMLFSDDGLGHPWPVSHALSSVCMDTQFADAELRALFDRSGHPFIERVLDFRELCRIEDCIARLRSVTASVATAAREAGSARPVATGVEQ